MGVCQIPRWIPLSCAFVLSCSSGPTLDPVEEGVQATIRVTSDRTLPSGDLEIPVYGSVVWLNSLPGEDQEIRITLDDPLAESFPCSTTVGFEERDGIATTPRGLKPSDFASICFHHEGEYHYKVTGGEREFEGTIRVVSRSSE